MKARINSTWSWVHFDNGEIWQVDKYDYVKFLESDNMMLRKGIMLEYEDLHK